MFQRMRILLAERLIRPQCIEFRLEIGMEQLALRLRELGNRFGGAHHECCARTIGSAECACGQGLEGERVVDGHPSVFQIGQIFVYERPAL